MENPEEENEDLLPVCVEHQAGNSDEIQTAKTAILPIEIMKEEWIINKKKLARMYRIDQKQAEERNKREEEEFIASLNESTMTPRERTFRNEFVAYLDEKLLNRSDPLMRYIVHINVRPFIFKMNRENKNLSPSLFDRENKRMCKILQNEYDRAGFGLEFYSNVIEIWRKASCLAFLCAWYPDVIS